MSKHDIEAVEKPNPSTLSNVSWEPFDPRIIKGVAPSKLNLAQMLKDINKIVETDWAADMEMLNMPGSRPFTQEEASEMAKALGNIYSISHCLTCKACQPKYFKPGVGAVKEASSNDSKPRKAKGSDAQF